MSRKRQTSTEPKTDEGKGTVLGECLAYFSYAVVWGLVGVLMVSLCWHEIFKDFFLRWLINVFFIFSVLPIIKLHFPNFLAREIVMSFTRRKVNEWQHCRQQRILQRKLLAKEWAGVPDGALSRAQPPGEPELTNASLSLAESPIDDWPRLTGTVGEETTEQKVSVNP